MHQTFFQKPFFSFTSLRFKAFFSTVKIFTFFCCCTSKIKCVVKLLILYQNFFSNKIELSRRILENISGQPPFYVPQKFKSPKIWNFRLSNFRSFFHFVGVKMVVVELDIFSQIPVVRKQPVKLVNSANISHVSDFEVFGLENLIRQNGLFKTKPSRNGFSRLWARKTATLTWRTCRNVKLSPILGSLKLKKKLM